MKNFYLAAGLWLGSMGLGQAQINDGGSLPVSWTYPQFYNQLRTVQAPALDMDKIAKEDDASAKRNEMYHIGRIVPVRISPQTHGSWQMLANGDRVWQLKIQAKDAKAMNLYFSRFRLPRGAKMHVYTSDRKTVLGGFGAHNNISEGQFATELIYADELIVEYYEPAHLAGLGDFVIEEVGHTYKDTRDFGDSGSCNVNVNCSEGTGRTQQRDAVARILVRVGASQGWCTGTMINNTSQNCTPYFLTAMHCSQSGASNASATDLNQWVFYFNYQATGCTNPASAPVANTITGATRRAYSNDNGGATGSDFYLLQLNSNPQASWNVFYAGWDRNNTTTSGAYGIHHPAGDIKKISTVSGSTASTSWGGSTPNTHWSTNWIATTNGHGITEGGSSGSALFNSSGRIVGTLTGGGSACTNRTAADAYGKFSYHWNSNGTSSLLRLSDWLDPTNTGVTTLDGVYFPCAVSTTDAGISSIINPAAGQLICANPFAPQVVLRNYGTTTLTTATINYRVDAGTISNFAWSGSLAANATTTITLPNVTVSNNVNFVFRAWTSNPNGGADAVISNDTSAATSRYNLPVAAPYAEAFNAGSIPTNLSFANPDLDTFVWEYISGVSAFGTGTGSMMFDNFNGTAGSNPAGKFDWLILPTLNLSGVSNPQIRFDLAYQFYNATYSDSLIIAVATNCSSTYTPIYLQGGSQISSAGTGTNEFTPTAAQWATRTVSLAAYANQNNISIAFINKSGYGNKMYLDNINVGSSCSMTASVASATNVACFGGATGSASVSVTGGVSPYTYAWSNGRTTASATGLAAGVYTITVRDATTTCSDTAQVTISQPSAALAGSVTTNTPVACFGATTGALVVAATGGTAPYTFNRGTGAQANGSFNSLSAGNYTVIITDASGCTASIAATVSQPSAALTSSISSQTNIGCFGASTGAFTIAATGGTAPYTFNRGTGAQANGNFSNLPAGNYNITITDANGCTVVRTVSLTQPASGMASSISSQTNPTCNGSNNGSFTVSVSGGASPYTFNRGTGAQSNGTFSGLTAGSYSVTITDASGCTTIQTASLTQPAAISSSVTSQNNVSCNGGANGSFTVAASGVSPFQFNIGTGAQSNGTFNNLAAGVYNLTITDANGCVATRAITITQPSSGLGVSVTALTHVACFGNNTGSFSIIGTGGTAPYTFNRGTGAQSNGSFNNLNAGTYTVTVTDANGCFIVLPVTINQPASAMSVSIGSQNNVSCFGGNDGSFVVNVVGGSNPYQFNRGQGNQVNSSFGGLTAGGYTITVTDTYGCTSTTNAIISQPSAAVAVSATATGVTCAGADGTASATATGGTAAYSFAWSNGLNGANLSNLNAGLINVTVTDANGCVATSNVIVPNNCAPCSVTLSSNTTNTSCAAACNGAATLTGAGGTAPYNFVWAGNVNTASRTGLCAGVYSVTVVDNAGCVAAQNVNIGSDAGITASSSSIDATCFGGANGSASVQTNGQAPLVFAWSNGSNSSSLSNLTAGGYGYTVTDANGCAANGLATISQPSPIITIPSVTDPSNAQGNNGTITLTTTGGTSPYTYDWAGIGNNVGASQSNLTAGTYMITTTDANGCQISTSASLVFTGVENVTAARSFVAMPNPSNGIFTVQIELNQAQPFSVEISNVLGQVLRSYQFDGQTLSLPVDISEQAAGVYFITLRTAQQSQTLKISSFQR